MEHRLSKVNRIKRLIPRKTGICFDDLLQLFAVKGYVRSGYFGNVYSVAFREDNNNNNNESEMIVPFESMKCVRGKPEFLMKVTYDSKESRSEIKILKYILKTVAPHSPHVFLYYNHVFCDSVKFKGRYKRGVAKSAYDWTYVKEGKGLISFIEYAGVTIERYFKQSNDMLEQYTFLFQLLYTLCVFQKAKLLHYDIYSTNVTVMETHHETPQVWKYTVKGNHYYVPVKKHIPVFIDFGQSEIQKSKLEVLLDNNNDAHMLITLFRDHTNVASIRVMCSRMLREIATKDTIRERYFDYSNILLDFFKKFTEIKQKPDHIWKL
jgi:hypothetical protein